MRKPDLVNVIADEADISKDKASLALNAVLDAITGAAKNGDAVSLVGFGTFEQRSRAARTGKNPQTGETIQIKASKTVAFKPGKALKDAVNG
ncbi:HU family DNA-binding protein [Endozoicomonas ascidiicola]|uniref:HU family DNA-binding protein n=1 Tax=Endozoicomonas ascidiicola TaxID=1698521 RepID=UPI00082DE0C7|nr:HU family DNA-binding protein [Endozoicomonas ascidiicola]